MYTHLTQSLLARASASAARSGSELQLSHVLEAFVRRHRHIFGRTIVLDLSPEPPREGSPYLGPALANEELGEIGPMSSEVTEALAFAQREAESMRHLRVGTEHIVLGILQVKCDFSETVLRRSGFSVEELREEMKRICAMRRSG